jgi:hypothetical protein
MRPVVEARRRRYVGDGEAHAHADDVCVRRRRAGKLRGLRQLDEIAVGIAHDHDARALPDRHGLAADRNHGGAELAEACEGAVEIAHRHDETVRAGILEVSVERPAARVRDFHHLYAAWRRRRARDRPADASIR